MESNVHVPIIKLEIEGMKHSLCTALSEHSVQMDTYVQAELENYCSEGNLESVIRQATMEALNSAVKEEVRNFFRYSGTGRAAVREAVIAYLDEHFAPEQDVKNVEFIFNDFVIGTPIQGGLDIKEYIVRPTNIPDDSWHNLASRITVMLNSPDKYKTGVNTYYNNDSESIGKIMFGERIKRVSIQRPLGMDIKEWMDYAPSITEVLNELL